MGPSCGTYPWQRPNNQNSDRGPAESPKQKQCGPAAAKAGACAHLLHSVQGADVVQRVQHGRQTAMQAEDLRPRPPHAS